MTPKEHRDVTCRGAADGGSTAAEEPGSGLPPLQGKLRASPALAPAPDNRPQAPVAAAGAVPGRRCSAERAAGSGGGRRASAPPSLFPPPPPSAPGWARPRQPGCGVLPCRPPCAMDWQVLTRELSLYLESQVRVGFFGSGVGLSLVLGFGVAYACYYLNSIAKVSGRAAGRAGSAGVPPMGTAPKVTATHRPQARGSHLKWLGGGGRARLCGRTVLKSLVRALEVPLRGPGRPQPRSKPSRARQRSLTGHRGCVFRGGRR